jgi:predicted small metal-binding protein
MAKLMTCACGWTLISPLGEEDIVKHTMLHLKENHPGSAMTPAELRKITKEV